MICREYPLRISVQRILVHTSMPLYYIQAAGFSFVHGAPFSLLYGLFLEVKLYLAMVGLLRRSDGLTRSVPLLYANSQVPSR